MGIRTFTHSSTHLIPAAASVLFPSCCPLFCVSLLSTGSLPPMQRWMDGGTLFPRCPFNPPNPADSSSHNTHTHKRTVTSSSSHIHIPAWTVPQPQPTSELPPHTHTHTQAHKHTALACQGHPHHHRRRQTSQLHSLFCLNFKRLSSSQSIQMLPQGKPTSSYPISHSQPLDILQFAHKVAAHTHSPHRGMPTLDLRLTLHT